MPIDPNLHKAASNNEIDVVRELLDIARLLIDRGAEIEARDKYGYTPLHNAAVTNSLDVAGLPIEHGANTDGIDLSWMNDQKKP